MHASEQMKPRPRPCLAMAGSDGERTQSANCWESNPSPISEGFRTVQHQRLPVVARLNCMYRASTPLVLPLGLTFTGSMAATLPRNVIKCLEQLASASAWRAGKCLVALKACFLSLAVLKQAVDEISGFDGMSFKTTHIVLSSEYGRVLLASYPCQLVTMLPIRSHFTNSFTRVCLDTFSYKCSMLAVRSLRATIQ
jgi:hypothetical protein